MFFQALVAIILFCQSNHPIDILRCQLQALLSLLAHFMEDGSMFFSQAII
jgi:hypothetical protein